MSRKPKDPLFKPMLAAKPDPEELDIAIQAIRYPVLASTKFDGIRCTIQNGVLLSRTLKPIPNTAMQYAWGSSELNGYDGEIIVGSPTAEDCFNRTTSVVMGRDKPMDRAMFYVFDRYKRTNSAMPFHLRIKEVCGEMPYVNMSVIDGKAAGTVHCVKHMKIYSAEELLKYEALKRQEGHEGVMVRDPAGHYKQGRSTMREGGLIAIKRFVDAEAVVVGTYEQEENTNEKQVNELGRSKRSSAKAGKIGKGTLGGFTVSIVERTARGLQFNIGTGVGLTDEVRLALWKRRKSLVGKIVKFRYQKIGTVDSPRSPIFLGFRDKGDM